MPSRSCRAGRYRRRSAWKEGAPQPESGSRRASSPTRSPPGTGTAADSAPPTSRPDGARPDARGRWEAREASRPSRAAAPGDPRAWRRCESYETVPGAPHSSQRHLRAHASVFSLLRTSAPQHGHFALFIEPSRPKGIAARLSGAHLQLHRLGEHAFCPGDKNGARDLSEREAAARLLSYRPLFILRYGYVIVESLGEPHGFRPRSISRPIKRKTQVDRTTLMEQCYQPRSRPLFTVARPIDARFAIECLLCAPFPQWYTEDNGLGDAAERRIDSHLAKGFAALALGHKEHTRHKADDAAGAAELDESEPPGVREDVG